MTSLSCSCLSFRSSSGLRSPQLRSALRELDESVWLRNEPSIAAPCEGIDSFLERSSATVAISRDKRDMIQRIPRRSGNFLSFRDKTASACMLIFDLIEGANVRVDCLALNVTADELSDDAHFFGRRQRHRLQLKRRHSNATADAAKDFIRN